MVWDNRFKSCPRVGGICCGSRGSCEFCCFKSCPRVGGIESARAASALMKVSSRAPVWGASEAGVLPVLASIEFQVVPPCGGHLGASSSDKAAKSFKSCPRVGGIRGQEEHRRLLQVSSRAPVWGASTASTRYTKHTASFKSCPRVGGIEIFGDDLTVEMCFKSCPRVGGIDPEEAGRQRPDVSSRAPVWGASAGGRAGPGHQPRFKSCPRVGGICNFAQKACC